MKFQKCNELLFQFHRNRIPFDKINLSTGCPNLVRQVKILGVTVPNDLRWSTHTFNIIKKANKRVFFKVQLKRAKIPTKEIVNFYCCCVRPVLEYACEVLHFALPKYLSDNIERVQRRINNGNCTEWSATWSKIKRVITKSHDREAGVRFVITSLISDQNCTTRSAISTLLHSF